MKKGIILFVGLFFIITTIMSNTLFTKEVFGNETQQYTGQLIVPKSSYNIGLGEYILDGTDVWTMEEEQQIVSREGIICTWVHDGKSEGLADYDSKLYPYYKHYCQNSEILAPCFVIIFNQEETMYTTYDQFKVELKKIKEAGANNKVQTFKAFYGKSVGTTNYVIENGNLSVTIPITVSKSSTIENTKATDTNSNEDASNNSSNDSIEKNPEIKIDNPAINTVTDEGFIDNSNQNLIDSSNENLIENSSQNSNESSILNSTQNKNLIESSTNNSTNNSKNNAIGSLNENPDGGTTTRGNNLAVLSLIAIPILLIALSIYLLRYKNKKHKNK